MLVVFVNGFGTGKRKTACLIDRDFLCRHVSFENGLANFRSM